MPIDPSQPYLLSCKAKYLLSYHDDNLQRNDFILYYVPLNRTTLELSVFWPSDIERRINELRFSEFLSLSIKTRLTSVTCFCGDVTLSKFQA